MQLSKFICANLEPILQAWEEFAVTIIPVTQNMNKAALLSASAGITEKLADIQNAGLQLAIDDFGTGYSSMTYLKKFAVNYLKIDQSFVQSKTTDVISHTIAEIIIIMAHKLGLKVIAEGVETGEQRDWLVTAGCDYAQGYLFAEPHSAKQFEKLLIMG